MSSSGITDIRGKYLVKQSVENQAETLPKDETAATLYTSVLRPERCVDLRGFRSFAGLCRDARHCASFLCRRSKVTKKLFRCYTPLKSYTCRRLRLISPGVWRADRILHKGCSVEPDITCFSHFVGDLLTRNHRCR